MPIGELVNSAGTDDRNLWRLCLHELELSAPVLWLGGVKRDGLDVFERQESARRYSDSNR
jgi:hypothetical protein